MWRIDTSQALNKRRALLIGHRELLGQALGDLSRRPDATSLDLSNRFGSAANLLRQRGLRQVQRFPPLPNIPLYLPIACHPAFHPGYSTAQHLHSRAMPLLNSSIPAPSEENSDDA
jgi:hypothetical protein